ncbi:endonuclease [Paraglaciecola sp. 20A4]|uniref:endonuclease n=1 Tax=Paraglaciecola sp. 20A4 TaxID=2687288 RepID=UPI00140D2F87|nr:endonuclease [Paraglaciecola sp. 20A4]
MRKVALIVCTTLFASHTAYANVENGSFENWTAGVPESWTTIDSGISLTQSASQVKSGNSSAAISVNTGSQGSTDFRQSVNVVAGQPYSASVWVRHTEGGVKARLYVNGYRGYSTANLVNQWQQLSYSYTPSASGSIEVGLRFYDGSSFDGSEIVYVDDFEPNSDGGSAPSACNSNSGSFELVTDNYASETSWQITNSQSVVVASGSGYANNTGYSEVLCLDDASYVFTIDDSYGDGICCNVGMGQYSLVFNGVTLASGSDFASSESSSFTLGTTSGGGGNGGGSGGLSAYYASAQGLTGYSLKSSLYNIIKGHTSQGYGALWTFYNAHGRDQYYENDGSILDIYSENPSGSESYTYTAVSDQCGNYSGEGNCYNREHSFPRSWFGGAVEPMNSDVHHIFATDGYVNSKRGSYPFGEVGSATFTSSNGSRLGSAGAGSGFTGTVFEPIDEFKGDIARAYFYMATRYQNVIGNWQSNSTSSNAVLDGSSDRVFESWSLNLLKSWHQQDPVSQKELDRNEAAYSHQGNRNPFIDYSQFVSEIWGQ